MQKKNIFSIFGENYIFLYTQEMEQDIYWTVQLDSTEI